LAAGLIVDYFGFGTAFLILGGVAGIALTVLLLLMPETVGARSAPFRGIGLSIPSDA